MQFYTYLHYNHYGSPFYVGKGCDGHGRRSHNFTKRNNHHKNIVAKYGAENILVYIFPCDSEQQAFADEIQQIAQLRREGYALCNQTNGGDGASGRIVSIETRAKITTARLLQKTPMLGKKHSAETKAKIGSAQKGKIVSVETRKKMSLGGKGKQKKHKGIPKSPEHRAKISASVNAFFRNKKGDLSCHG